MAEIPTTRASLLVRLRDPKDSAAWSEFVDLYAPLIYNYARKQGLQDADAVDLSQEIISVVAGAVSRFEYDPQRGLFRNWLLKVVWRKLSNWRRAEKFRPHGSGDSGAQHLLESHPEADQVQQDWDLEWQRRVFDWACEQVRKDVTESTWQAFWRTAIDDHPGKLVAEELGMSVAAVYRARSRVLARLKDFVQSAQEQ